LYIPNKNHTRTCASPSSRILQLLFCTLHTITLFLTNNGFMQLVPLHAALHTVPTTFVTNRSAS